MTLYSGSECVAKCEVLRGAEVETVVRIEDRFGEATGWVALTGSNGLESLHLRDLTDVDGHSNENYLRAVQACAGALSCKSCVLKPYTMDAYVERGELERVSRRQALSKLVPKRFK